MWQTLRTPLEHPSDQLAGASASGSEPGVAEDGSDVGSGSENGSGDGSGSGDASEAEGARRGSGSRSVSGSDGEDGAVEAVHRRPH